jgi:two-component system, NtrC family, nitrogen regulation sensor histidine kinase NtrY
VALAFRHRIFVWLVVIATVPAAVAVSVSLLSPDLALPVGGVEAWERAGDTWREATRHLDLRRLPPATRLALERHGDELTQSVRRARQVQAFRYAISGTLAGVLVGLAVLVAGGAVRLAGHLSRQLSRPIDDLVDWTGRIARREPLPEGPEVKGAPEFRILRDAFRRMAADLEAGRAREVEAAQLRTFRDVARQVAHELKNPLTPLRFAVSRLRKEATPAQAELLEILDGESQRIEQMARDFSSLGRLPEGPPAPVDLGELLEGVARASVPADLGVQVEREGTVPMTVGHYEPLRRAFQNLLLNAADAVRMAEGAGARGHGGTEGAPATPRIVVRLAPAQLDGRAAVAVAVADRGPGIRPEAIGRVFEPYFTTKANGTGLGLAIVRQTILDHGGSITASNAPEGGAVFTVTLPAEHA